MAAAPCPGGWLFVLEELDDRLGARLDVELFVNGVEMGADGAGADGELVGDFLVEIAFGKESEDFVLPFGELLDFGGRGLDLLKVADNLAGDLGNPSFGIFCSENYAKMNLVSRIDP